MSALHHALTFIPQGIIRGSLTLYVYAEMFPKRITFESYSVYLMVKIAQY